ncbi:MAG: hypothetical protein AB7O45_02945 [Alphaproteobacteria bacterium]
MTIFASVCVGVAANAADDRALFEAVLANPTDVQANLRYARAVERRGDGRQALMAYERVLSVEPGNAEARAGIQRLTGGALPTSRTSIIAGVGLQYESNPRLLDQEFAREDDIAALASLRIDDIREIGGRRWRSRLTGQLRAYHRFTDGTLGYAGADTGPLIDIAGWGEVRPLVGIEHAQLTDGPLFSAAYLGAELVSPSLAPLRAIDLIASYADFSDEFPGRDGFLVRLRPQLAWTDLAAAGDRLSVEPEVAYNAATGEQHRYRYWSAGVVASYLLPVADDVLGFARLYAGPELAIEHRQYAGRDEGATEDRRDTRYIPGLRLIGTGFLDDDVTVVLRYYVERNRSNEADKEFTNHVAGVVVYRRF